MPRINYYVLIKGTPCLLENQTISACENVEQEGQGLEGKEGERERGRQRERGLSPSCHARSSLFPSFSGKGMEAGLMHQVFKQNDLSLIF